MRKIFFLIFISVALAASGCNAVNNEAPKLEPTTGSDEELELLMDEILGSDSKAKVENKEPDFFAKKTECAKYIDMVKADLERNYNDDERYTAFVKMCYSKKYNTCVAFYRLNFIYGSNAYQERSLFYSYIARDALSDQMIDYSDCLHGDTKNCISGQKRVDNEIDCAE